MLKNVNFLPKFTKLQMGFPYNSLLFPISFKIKCNTFFWLKLIALLFQSPE